jgi:hypothetical protein
MNVERKPHPHSIEAILGLKDTSKQNVQSFRPYSKPKTECIAMNETCASTGSSFTRLVPRAGRLPRASVLLKAETERWFVRCGLQTQPDNLLEKMDAYSFRATMLRTEISDQGI